MSLGLPLGSVLLIAIATTAWRRGYYGAWVPNTYVLKVSSVPPSWRILNGLIAALMHIGMNLPAWMLAGVGLWAWRSSRKVWVAASLLGVSMAYSVYVGGDIYEAAAQSNRFLLNGFTSLLLFASMGVACLPAKPILQGALILLVSYGLPIPLPSQVGYRWKGLFRSQREFFHSVSPLFPSGSRLLIGTAGTTPYFFREYHWIDLFGKVDSMTARRGLVMLCNGRPPLLYFSGHTRLDTFRLWDADGIVGGVFLEFRLCEDSVAVPLGAGYWWFKLVQFISPCQSKKMPWFPFPTPALRNRFCATYEPIEERPTTWRRRTKVSPYSSKEKNPPQNR